MTKRFLGLGGWLAAVGIVAAQAPPPSGRVPIYPNQNPRPVPSFGGAAGPNFLPQQFPGGGGFQPSAPVQYNPAFRPTVSPYLNLFRGGIPAVNYYNFVRPGTLPDPLYQAQTQMANPPVRPGLGVNVDSDVILEADTVLRPTGHPATFMNYGGFFNTAGTIGGVARPGPTGRSPNMRR